MFSSAYNDNPVLNLQIFFHKFNRKEGPMDKKRCYKGFYVDEDFNIYNIKTKRRLTPFVGSDGYLQVTRRAEDGRGFHQRVHVIFAHLFIPNPNNYKYVNHIDSNKLNNSLENLEWCTNSYNVLHGWNSGNRTHRNNTKVRAIKNGEIYEFSSIRQLGETLKLDRHKVARILKKEIKNRYDYEFEYI